MTPGAPQGDGAAVSLAARRPLPKITLLIALYREPETLPVLLQALEALDWPRERLEVLLALEADDAATLAALASLAPPPFLRVLTVPPGEPRTKPRALNFALDFAEGEIVGVYDAEDRPDPDQLRRVAAVLRDSPPDVACVQCRLTYYNTSENWLTRCFGIEYAIWFDVMLAAFRDLGFPVPLGGTSVFFRRRALERVGAWDAHNVTEDADLGMRLAREGFRTEICGSTTHEEANSRLGPWIRQRSRWLKGYMTTWLVHMRDPRALFRDLGPVGFLGFQALFVGAAVAYLGLPLFWAAWGLGVAGLGPAWLDVTPFWALAAVAVVQLSGWLAMLCAALIATARRGLWALQVFIPTLVFYWPIGALAAWLALAEMFVAPFHWRKTPHGVGRLAASAREAALAARERRDAA
jgi:cellulose synthase/poly-beta-1,6-N-acetylglucosamine synthase-like glycosyltransferase